ncbi:SDR family NAD(P)-dependent oxidoreductase [Mycobacterium sp. IS-1264]|uniref:SDR family NAD(P)-dependent oxidoreductase n=1 Tax=Mycobacterium sp. IS-1264 TaxID=1834158 RepID=UPI00147A527A|nr:SDR family NAD(P)-dependent oxidoreductase [Mycobacterium sp. IS-1264]
MSSGTNSRRRTAVITGASRGLGRLSAAELALRGWQVVAAMRSPERDGASLVQEVGRAGEIELLKLDLVDSASIEAAARQLADRPVDALVHIAGLAPAAAFEDTSREERVSTFQTNLLGPMHLTALLLPGMRERGIGRIVAVASLAARVGMPLSSVYGASKAALEKWIESLAVEIHQFGLSAHVLEAGMFDTEMILNNDVPEAVGPYGPMYANFSERRASVVARARPAAKFATALADTLEKQSPPVLELVGVDAVAVYYLQRLIPRKVITTVMKRAVAP